MLRNNENILNKIIKIQSWYRKIKIKIIKDNFSKKILEDTIILYNNIYQYYNNINKQLINKKMRKPNYPSEITENIVKFAIKKYYGVIPTWDTKKGDLFLFDKQLEVKGSLDLYNGGPSSFGPQESWHRIYFVDCKNHDNLIFKVFEVKLSNDSEIWKNLKINKSQTFKEQCDEKRRPRIKFYDLMKQIPKEYINIIFHGNINEL
tara:strand:- start:2436 stop:3050 length:615 start_codon:yes stop_codon:yes gene_type:complete